MPLRLLGEFLKQCLIVFFSPSSFLIIGRNRAGLNDWVYEKAQGKSQ
jgi:hypothetical protein